MSINYGSSNLFSQSKYNVAPVSLNDTLSFDDGYTQFVRSSFDNDSNLNSGNTSATEITSAEFNSTTGYGLVDAAAAVAKVAGQSRFEDVPNVGGNNWGAELVNAPEAWAKGYTGKGVVVAVLDTGVDRNHEDLKNNVWKNSNEIAGNGKDDDGNGFIDDVYGWNFDGGNNNTLDIDGHGTHVSGTIAGTRNDFGVTGIAYDSQIMPVKVLSDEGSGTNTAVADGIYYAVDNGADVINLSLGGMFSSDEIESALEYASDRDVIVVMAAGNSGYPLPGYPARYAEQYGLAVGAVDKNNRLTSFSNQAGWSSIAYVTAPGVDIYSTLPNNRYASYSGTSMATPHVAGVVALMLSADQSLTDAQVRQTITETARGSSGEAFFGFSMENSPHIVQSRAIAYEQNINFGETHSITSNPQEPYSVAFSERSPFLTPPHRESDHLQFNIYTENSLYKKDKIFDYGDWDI